MYPRDDLRHRLACAKGNGSGMDVAVTDRENFCKVQFQFSQILAANRATESRD